MPRMDRIGKTATTVKTCGDDVYVQYHETVVFHKNGNEVTVKTGGWTTATTRTRINQACNVFGVPANAYIKGYCMYIDTPQGVLPVERDGTTFTI